MLISVLGLGAMGAAFAGRALDAGHSVTVWNRSPGRAAALVEAGATVAGTVSEAAAGAEVVLAVVADDAAVRSVALGPDGALAALGDGAVFSNVSTVAPATARELAAAGPADRVLDSPVMGSPAAISGGHGRFLVGGAAATVERLAPLWTTLGAGYVHCGPSGSGATVKVAQNLMLVTGVTAMAEAITLARGQGVDDELLRRVFSDSLVVSPAMALRLGSVLDPEHPGWFSPALARKDVRLAATLEAEAGAGPGLATATDALLSRVVDGDTDWSDFSAVIEGLKGA